MTRYFQLLLLFTVFLFFSERGKAQKKDSIHVGIVNGLVRDSVHNYVMQSATVSIYRAADDHLINFQLTNNFGRFSVTELPIAMKLKAVVTYVGYKPYTHEFIISAESKKVDFKTFNVLRADNQLKEVAIVGRPPMQMNGDTLEVFVDALGLDTNIAVAEDALRKVKAITLWADGKITVNGKQVSSLKVNGKEFFGGDSKVALQNISVTAIEKIQVYQEEKKTDEDPPATMNIVLKKDKQSGFFGKIGGGYGTDDRYATDGMLSKFSTKTQLSVVGSSNNVNKTASDINTLMNYSSFKGEGIDQNYQPDFRGQGLNVFHSAGLTLQHDFLGLTTPQNNRNKILKADYMLVDTRQETIENLSTLVSLTGDQQLLRDNKFTSKNDGISHRSTGSFDYKSENTDFRADYSLRSNSTQGLNTQNQHSINTTTQEESRNQAEQRFDNLQNARNLKAAYASHWMYDKSKKKSLSFNIDYDFNEENGHNNIWRTTDFRSATNPQSDQYFNREYLSDYNRVTHSSRFSTANLLALWMENPRARLEFRNSLSWYQAKGSDLVTDLNDANGQNVVNSFLSNNNTYRTMDARPGLSLSRSFLKNLDNRYRKNLRLNATVETRYFNQRNRSDKAFQRIDRSYNNILPSASIRYDYEQSGVYISSYSISYSTSNGFPGLGQIAPLVDSSNVYFLNLGNPNLKSTYSHELGFNFSRSGVGTNTFNWRMGLKLRNIRNYIADSNNYDALGRNVHYYVNAFGHRALDFNHHLDKAFKLKNHQIQLQLMNFFNYSRNPLFINGEAFLSSNVYSTHSFSLNYSMKDALRLSMTQGLYTYSSSRKNAEGFNNRNWSTNFAAGVNLPRKIYVSSNITYNKSISSFAEPVNFTIWNANVGCRFMKGNNAELKFSALDLLRQNKSVINYSGDNSTSTGTVNVLQQYFMLTLAYFPRKFGK